MLERMAALCWRLSFSPLVVRKLDLQLQFSLSRTADILVSSLPIAKGFLKRLIEAFLVLVQVRGLSPTIWLLRTTLRLLSLLGMAIHSYGNFCTRGL
jgi:hypothetical protein